MLSQRRLVSHIIRIFTSSKTKIMGIFQVHPHFGYLNSDVKLVNNGVDALRVKDSVLGQEYDIPAKSSICIRLSAGEHRFVSKAEEGIVETVVVEDAIKLGGSKQKNTYIFDETPWAVMVMLDRTYFFNRETNERYIEHGLVPEEVIFLNQNYLLFVSKDDHSLFSLDSLSIEKTIVGSSFLFSTEECAAFSVEKGVILYSLTKSYDIPFNLIECDDFAIDRINKRLYYSKKKEPLKIYSKLLSLPFNSGTSLTINQKFRCFVGEHSAILGFSTRKLNIMDLRTKSIFCLYDQEIPITSINNKTIWDNQLLNSINNPEIVSGVTSNNEIQVYERGERWYYILKSTTTIKDNRLSESTVFSLHITSDNKTYLKTNNKLSIIHGSLIDCIYSDDEKGVWLSNNEMNEFTGKPIASTQADVKKQPGFGSSAPKILRTQSSSIRPMRRSPSSYT